MLRSVRIALSCGAALLMASVCGCASTAGPAGPGSEAVRPWRLTASTYTFRNGTFFEAVDKTKALGLRYIEAHSWMKLGGEYPGAEINYKAPAAALDAAKRKLNEAGIKLVAYYHNGMGDNEAETRKVFEFAKSMGIETIVSEPKPSALDLLDKLTAEYDVNIAIHNHPKDAKHPAYVNWNPDEVVKQLEGRGPRIGTCADTGHWVRSGVDPVEAIKKYRGRLISLHLKDIEKPTVDSRDVPWGTGIANVKGVLAELQRERFAGIFTIEYEHNPQDNMADVRQCIEYFVKVTKELGR